MDISAATIIQGGFAVMCLIIFTRMLAVFSVFQSQAETREKAMFAQQEAQRSAQEARDTRTYNAFKELNDRHHEVQIKTVGALTDLQRTQQALHDEIRSRPCVAEDKWDPSKPDRRKREGE